jgi:hypothetical protein
MSQVIAVTSSGVCFRTGTTVVAVVKEKVQLVAVELEHVNEPPPGTCHAATCHPASRVTVSVMVVGVE